MFACVVLGHIIKFAGDIFQDDSLAKQAAGLKNEIEYGIRQYGIIHDDEFGDIFAYETDGLGHYHLMDDANVPSLLSIPWLKYTDSKDQIYQNTRKFILSKRNPYYYEGTHAKGIGSPHTPDQYIWHISLIMQGLTSNSEKEKETLLETLLSTDGGKNFMHEGFFCSNPDLFTRDWFAWANSLFALFVLETGGIIK
jgi:meiotically up-regulated gene 157 (Mug157) protein